MKHLCILLIQIYQWVVAPVKRLLSGGKGTCRYDPSCSQYAIRALQVHGFFKGIGLAGMRILRCHPWGGFGLDKVPLHVKWRQLLGIRLSEEAWRGHASAIGGAVLVNGKGKFVAEGATPADVLNTALQGSRTFDGGMLFTMHECDAKVQPELEQHQVEILLVTT